MRRWWRCAHFAGPRIAGAALTRVTPGHVSFETGLLSDPIAKHRQASVFDAGHLAQWRNFSAWAYPRFENKSWAAQDANAHVEPGRGRTCHDLAAEARTAFSSHCEEQLSSKPLQKEEGDKWTLGVYVMLI